MRKKILIGLMGLFCLTFAGNAYAEAWYSWSWGDYGNFYLNDSADPTAAEKYEFLNTETPYLHISIHKSYFVDPGETSMNFNELRLLSKNGDEQYFFNNSSSSLEWDSVTGMANRTYSLADWNYDYTLGDWALLWKGEGIGKNKEEVFFGTANFTTVTPEPISCLLFLVGAGPLAFFKYRKKKTIQIRS